MEFYYKYSYTPTILDFLRNSNPYQWKTFKIRNYKVPLKTKGENIFFPEIKGKDD